MSNVTFKSNRLLINKSAKSWELAVEKQTPSNDSCCVSVFVVQHPSYPNAPYTGEFVFEWQAFESGLKTITIPIIPSKQPCEYLQLVLGNYLRCSAGEITTLQVAFVSNPKLVIGVFKGYVPLSRYLMQRYEEENNVRYSFLLPSDARLGEIRNRTTGEYLEFVSKKVVTNPWQGIVEFNRPIEDNSLEIWVELIPPNF